MPRGSNSCRVTPSSYPEKVTDPFGRRERAAIRAVGACAVTRASNAARTWSCGGPADS
ncbi:hypothetical protein [Streptomyces sp. NPDC095613]|uniref:hypothetical protein n=1 Tax=Streptomyces sp. NPDC095613 TaxID=3155540 RepID=UPI00331771F8